MSAQIKLLSSFKKLNKYINKGDTIYLETDLIKFKPVFEHFKNKKKFLEFFLNLFIKLVGKNGNIVVPAFSYSWGKNKKLKKFNVKKTKPETGIFSSYLLEKKEFKRTLDPMFSFFVYGKKKFELLNIKKDSFGKNSVFHKINNKKTKLISFGINRFDPTFVHYVEQYFDENINSINYRYKKKFFGSFENSKNKNKKETFFSFVRNEKTNLFFSGKNIYRDLSKKGKIKSFFIFNSPIHIVPANFFFDTGIEGMKKDIHYFVKRT